MVDLENTEEVKKAEKEKMHKKMLKLLLQEKKYRQKIGDKYDWKKRGRANQQIPEGNWKIWLILAGRGFGKTRTGAETIKMLINDGYKRVCLLGNTELDVQNVMIKGESGLMNVYPKEQAPKITKSDRTLKWSNGAQASIISATAYEQLRGPQFDCAWVDEFAKFPDPQAALEQLLLALRLNSSTGKQPKMIITTTPKPLPILKKLLERKDVVVTYGSTFDNKDNLSNSYLESVQETFNKSKFGAQELFGQIVEDDEYAFCTSNMIQMKNISSDLCSKIIIAIDPAATNRNDETGIIVCGLYKNEYYVLEDASNKYTPTQWSTKAVELYKKYKADCIVAEVNQGGDMVETLIKQIDNSVAYKKVYATRGKMIRAQPIMILYEQGKVYHVDKFELLEEQMLTSKHAHSPDRLDALVWGLTYLLEHSSEKKNEFFLGILT